MSVSHLRFILIFNLLDIFFTEVEADHTAHGNLTLIFLFSREVEDQDDPQLLAPKNGTLLRAKSSQSRVHH